MKTKLRHIFQGSFGLLNGLNFADQKSRENALWAMLWGLDARSNCGAPPRPPIVVIQGPAASGKTTLAQRIAPDARSYSNLKLAQLNRIVRDDARVVIIEGANNAPIDAQGLAGFARSTKWRHVRRKDKRVIHHELRTLLILTVHGGDALACLPAEVLECCVFINLKSRPA